MIRLDKQKNSRHMSFAYNMLLYMKKAQEIVFCYKNKKFSLLSRVNC